MKVGSIAISRTEAIAPVWYYRLPMRRSDFHYHLPEELIAQFPLQERGGSRLLCLRGEDGEMEDRRFSDLPELLQPEDLLVFNDTRVIPARLYGRKSTGGQVEILIERLSGPNRALAHVRAARTPLSCDRHESRDGRARRGLRDGPRRRPSSS